MDNIISLEKKLIEKAIKGDEESFESLILSCKGKAYNIALRYVGNKDDALDILQDSFIKVFRSLPNFKGDSRFETWVYRIVVNTCKDFIRKETSKPKSDSIYHEYKEEEYIIDIKDNDDGPEEKIMQNELGNYIIKCLNKLKEEQKEILILRDIQGFSYEEIAKILNCNIGTVKSRIARSRNALRKIYISNKQKD